MLGWRPDDAPQCSSGCSYTLLDDLDGPQQPLPFRSVWEIPQLISASEALNIQKLRRCLGTDFLTGYRKHRLDSRHPKE